jgi:hypothetical protein
MSNLLRLGSACQNPQIAFFIKQKKAVQEERGRLFSLTITPTIAIMGEIRLHRLGQSYLSKDC